MHVWLCMHVWVRMHACVHARVHAMSTMYVCTMYVCTRVCNVHVCMYACTLTLTLRDLDTRSPATDANPCVHVHMHILMYARMHAWMCA